MTSMTSNEIQDEMNRLRKTLAIEQKERKSAGLRIITSNCGGIQELLDAYKGVTESL